MSEELVKYEIGQKAELAYLDTELVGRIATVVQKVAQWAQGMKPPEIGLVVRRAISMGVDPLNPHEIQIWKDKRGVINMQLAYTLMTEWVKRFKGKHTEPQYVRLTGEQLSDEGLSDDDVAYYARFVMIDDLANVVKFSEVFGAEMARQMYTVTGLGVAARAEYDSPYFAANGRSKSWKVQKRALTDAYRRKFGTPTQAEIMSLRRMVSYDTLEPDDWEDTAGLAPGDAAALAKSKSQWDAHTEAMTTDAEYREVHEAQNATAASALFGEPPADLDYDGQLIDEGRLDADIAQVAQAVAAQVPADLPQKWPQFCQKAQDELGYESSQHVLTTLKNAIGAADYSPFYTSGPKAGKMADAAGAWNILLAHLMEKEGA